MSIRMRGAGPSKGHVLKGPPARPCPYTQPTDEGGVTLALGAALGEGQPRRAQGVVQERGSQLLPLGKCPCLRFPRHSPGWLCSTDCGVPSSI